LPELDRLITKLVIKRFTDFLPLPPATWKLATLAHIIGNELMGLIGVVWLVNHSCLLDW